MERCKSLEVYMSERKVGTLALYRERLAAFEYTDEWLRTGFAISPFKLPLQKKVFMPKADPLSSFFSVPISTCAIYCTLSFSHAVRSTQSSKHHHQMSEWFKAEAFTILNQSSVLLNRAKYCEIFSSHFCIMY